MESDKNFITELIETYRKHSALWDHTDEKYKNKNLRNRGINELIDKCAEFDIEADPDFIKKKLNNLRTAFRRELMKVRKSKRTASSSDDIYVPSLWYYNMMLFISEHDADNEADKNDLSSFEGIEGLDYDMLNHDDNHDTSLTTPSPSSSRHRRPRKSKIKEPKTEFIDFDPQDSYTDLNTSFQNGSPLEDECTVIGKRFAFQLRGMNEKQRLIAEKIISDVMFWGRMGKLSENSFKYNPEATILDNSLSNITNV